MYLHSCSYGETLTVVCCHEKVRLIAVTSDTAPIKPSAGVAPIYRSDELLYYRVFEGVLSLRLIESHTEESAYRLLICLSSDTSPMLVNIVNSLSVQTLNKPANQNIGSRHVYQSTFLISISSVHYFCVLVNFVFVFFCVNSLGASLCERICFSGSPSPCFISMSILFCGLPTYFTQLANKLTDLTSCCNDSGKCSCQGAAGAIVPAGFTMEKR